MTARQQDMAAAKLRVMETGCSLQEALDQIRGDKYGERKSNKRKNGEYENGNGGYKYKNGEKRGAPVEAEYIYEDKDGKNYLRVERTEQFPQSHWENDAWVYGAPKGPKIPYLLPYLLAASPEVPVFICEGEKDADSIYCLRYTSEPDTVKLISTCASEGAGKWTKDLNHWFAGKQTVYILEDNDDAGRAHAQQVAQNLKGIVGEIRIVSLPGLAEHGDVSDWIEARKTAGLKSDQARAELLRLCAAAPLYKEPSAPLFSEEDLALRFSKRHGDELRFIAKWGQWYRYDGQRWKPDDTRKTFSLARELCRDVAANTKGRNAKAIASGKTRMAVVSLASDDRRHAATVDQWDADLSALNTPDGVNPNNGDET